MIKCPNCQKELVLEENFFGRFRLVISHNKQCPHCKVKLFRHYSSNYYVLYLIVLLAILFFLYFMSIFIKMPTIFWLLFIIAAVLGLYLFFIHYCQGNFYRDGTIVWRFKKVNREQKEVKKVPGFIYDIPTKVYFGPDQLDNLAAEIKKYGHKVLLCYGGGSIKRNGLYDRVCLLLSNHDIPYAEVANIEPNPHVESVRRGRDVARRENCDLVLAVGGGSVIDCAKFIAAAYYWDKDPWDISLGKAEVVSCLPIITILTLAATGSEMNATGVITNEETHQKIGASYPLMFPKVSFLDPTLTYSVNKYQTSCGSADIFFHVLEVYFNPRESMFLLDSMMEGIMKTVVKYSKIALAKPDDYEARANLMWSSSWAINGLIKEYQTHRWSAHAMEHPLSAYYDLTHGLGLAIIVPKWLEYALRQENCERYCAFGHNVFDLPYEDDRMAMAHKALDALKKYLYEELELNRSFTECGIDDTYFVKMANDACKGKAIDGFVPLNVDDVVEIYKLCL